MREDKKRTLVRATYSDGVSETFDVPRLSEEEISAFHASLETDAEVVVLPGVFLNRKTLRSVSFVKVAG